jgi:hypothetical protein
MLIGQKRSRRTDGSRPSDRALWRHLCAFRIDAFSACSVTLFTRCFGSTLTELALGGDGVKHLQEKGPKQILGQDGGPASFRVYPLKQKGDAERARSVILRMGRKG